MHEVVLRLLDSWSKWNLEMLVFEKGGKPEYPKKNYLEERREPTTNSTHIWLRHWDLNPGHNGGRRGLSPLRHPLLLKITIIYCISTHVNKLEEFHSFRCIKSIFLYLTPSVLRLISSV